MRPTKVLVLMFGIVLAYGTAIPAQQHSYTKEEIDAGNKIYDTSCGSCHGENGDRVTGIDFSKGTFKTAKSDEDIVRIVRNGVPNTGMPSSPGISETQASTVVAFVRSLVGGRVAGNAVATALTGDAARGKTVFEGKGTCLSCHAVNGAGATSGPDLGGARGGQGGQGGRGGARGAVAGGPPAAPPAAGAPPAGRGGRGGAPAAGGRGAGAPPPGAGAPVAAGAPAVPAVPAAAQAPRGGGGGARGANAPNPQQIERSILDPSAEMAAPYRVYQVIARNNVTARGLLLNQDTFSVQMRDSNDKLISFWKTDLREFGFLPSPMPSFKDKLTPQEIADVVSYLVSLRTN